MLLNSGSDGRRIGDVIEFVYSEKVEVDITKIQKQVVKINKEINKFKTNKRIMIRQLPNKKRDCSS